MRVLTLLLVKAYNPYSTIRPGQSTQRSTRETGRERGGDKLIACVKTILTLQVLSVPLLCSFILTVPPLQVSSTSSKLFPATLRPHAILGCKLAASIRYLPASGSLHPSIISRGVGKVTLGQEKEKGKSKVLPRHLTADFQSWNRYPACALIIA